MSYSSRLTSGCGIVGTVNCDISDTLMEAMTDALAHRGPDGRQTWISADRTVRLGHRRLAIIGVDERGVQPMSRAGLTVACNGEIYNYPELRGILEKLGYVFQSDCDTEVILHGYAEWGLDCLNRLNGIFALGLYDQPEKRLILARDRLGVKPLVLCEVGNRGLMFASEAKALLKCPLVPRQANFDMIRADLLHGLLGPKQNTWFTGINNLKPGHYMVIDCSTGMRQVSEYWHIPDGPADIRNELEIVESLRETFRNAVRLQRLSDVGLSISLSGGIDSAAVAAISLEIDPSGVDAFTLEYEENRPFAQAGGQQSSDDQIDLQHARRMARSFPNLRLHEVPLSIPKLFDRQQIDAAILASDEYVILDSRMLAMGAYYELVRQNGHKVLLSGQGADEVWLGYYEHPLYSFFRHSAEQLSAEYLVTEFFGRWIPMGFQAWNPKFINPLLARDSSRENLEMNYRCSPTDDPLNRISQFIIRTHLQSLLHVDDRMAMLSGLEVRVPWLDHRLVEMGLKIPGHIKLNSPDRDHKVKWLVKQAMRGIVPDHILDRPKVHFPEPAPALNVLRLMVKEDADKIRKSTFLREMFAASFLENFAADSDLLSRDLFTIYFLWRFGELHRF